MDLCARRDAVVTILVLCLLATLVLLLLLVLERRRLVYGSVLKRSLVAIFITAAVVQMVAVGVWGSISVCECWVDDLDCLVGCCVRLFARSVTLSEGTASLVTTACLSRC
jgi:quinol-cytochrome oxidoreductase complex cytochrome b subunit